MDEDRERALQPTTTSIPFAKIQCAADCSTPARSTAYISFDDGERWQAFKNGLPDTPVSDLVVEKNSLAIGTHGRSFYVMDDRPRFASSAVATTGSVVLFKPADVIRGLDRAGISYYLKHATEEPDDRLSRCQGAGDAVGQRTAAAPSRRQTNAGRWWWWRRIRRAAGRTHGGGRESLLWDLNSTPVVVVPRDDPVGRDTKRSDGAARLVLRCD